MGHGAEGRSSGAARRRGTRRGRRSEGGLGRWDVQMGGSRWPTGSALSGEDSGGSP